VLPVVMCEGLPRSRVFSPEEVSRCNFLACGRRRSSESLARYAVRTFEVEDFQKDNATSRKTQLNGDVGVERRVSARGMSGSGYAHGKEHHHIMVSGVPTITPFKP
jgi:hypothetical protein